MEKILLLGAGGLGKEAADLIRATDQYEAVGFLDDDPVKINTLINQVPVLDPIGQLDKYRSINNIFIAVANPGFKKRLALMAKALGFQFPNLIHPSVVIGNNVSLGCGNMVCAGTILSAEVCLKDFITINPQCGIGHETILHSYSTFYWGVHIGGNTVIEEGCELGSHSCVLQGMRLAANVILGAGAVVVKSIDANGTYVGVPAKKIKP